MNISYDQFLVLLLLLSWSIALVFHYRKILSYDAGCFVMTTYICYALASFLLFDTSYIYFDPKPLKIFPFVYLFIMMYLGLKPVLNFNSNRTIIVYPSYKLINIVSCIFIFSTLAHFPTDLSNISTGLVKMLSDSSGANDMYTESIDSISSSGSKISNLTAVISNAFAQIGFLLTVFYLLLPKKNKIILYGLFISSIMKMASGIALGQRGGIVEPILVLLATYFLLKSYLSIQIRKIITYIGISLIILLSVPVIVITISRFDNSKTNPLESTYYYLGVENVNFNNYALDNGGIRYGDRTVPLFKRFLGFENVPKNFHERRIKYPHLKINDNTFSTYVGDIAIDYGPILGAIIIIYFSCLFVKISKPRNNFIGFHQLLAIHFILYMCTLGGIKLFTYSDVGGNLKIIVFVFFYILFKHNYKFQLKKNVQI